MPSNWMNTTPSISESVPRTLPAAYIERMKRQLGTEADAFLHVQTYGFPVRGLRINRLKERDREETLSVLRDAGLTITPVPWEEDGYYFEETDFPGRLPLYATGLYYIQEPSAMLPVTLLDVKPGERILDLCAAPGGKATQIASGIQGEGLLVCNEVIPKRARILAENIERAGVPNVMVTNEAPERLAGAFAGFFDAVLVDAPCSGEGMFRKSEEAIRDWSEETVHQCATRQAAILDAADLMLRDGGRLVYSTCTFAEEEDEAQVSAFLNRHPAYRLIKEERLYPHLEQCEGHFAAALTKGEETEFVPMRRLGKPVSRKQKLVDTGIWEAFAEDLLTKEGRNRITPEGVVRRKDALYAADSRLPEDAGCHVLRRELHLGDIRNSRFVPSHTLAMILRKEDVRRAVLLDPDGAAARSYLRGNSVSLSDDDVQQSADTDGFCLVLCGDYPLGFGKCVKGIVKNHYPKGLRFPVL